VRAIFGAMICFQPLARRLSAAATGPRAAPKKFYHNCYVAEIAKCRAHWPRRPRAPTLERGFVYTEAPQRLARRSLKFFP
jgi:hypothetical protein